VRTPIQEFKSLLSTIFKRFLSKLKKVLNHVSSFSFFVGKRRKKVVVMLLALIIFASALFLFGSIFGHLVFRSTIRSHGAVKAFGVGVYQDNNCSSPVSSIDWGLVEPGLASNITFYVMNEGNYPVTLFLGAENWNPANASNYLSLGWDYVGQIINPSETVQVTLSLLASSDIEDVADFSFDVIISGSG